MNAHQKRLNDKIAALSRGENPQLTRAEYLGGEVGAVPGPDVRCTLRLARAIHRAESTSCVTSWPAQERALAYYNAHGLGAALDECARLEAIPLASED